VLIFDGVKRYFAGKIITLAAFAFGEEKISPL
jgi:hypothetical protein